MSKQIRIASTYVAEFINAYRAALQSDKSESLTRTGYRRLRRTIEQSLASRYPYEVECMTLVRAYASNRMILNRNSGKPTRTFSAEEMLKIQRGRLLSAQITRQIKATGLPTRNSPTMKRIARSRRGKREGVVTGRYMRMVDDLGVAPSDPVAAYLAQVSPEFIATIRGKMEEEGWTFTAHDHGYTVARPQPTPEQMHAEAQVEVSALLGRLTLDDLRVLKDLLARN